jgi:VWFA-related protein
VVRDKNGNPVGNLHKGDFQLADRGQKQDIATFSEEKLERPATVEKAAAQSTPDQPASQSKAPSNVIPDRFTAYIFDDVHMRRGDLAPLREAIWRHMQETASPSERIAIFTTSRRVFTDFTADLDKLHAALYKITSTYMYRVPSCPQPPAPCFDVSFFLGYQVDKGNTLALQTAGTIVKSPLPALNSTGLKQPAQITGNSGMYAETAATHAVRTGEQETSLSLDALRDVARRMMALAGRRTIVMLSQGVFVPYEQEGELERAIDWVQRSGVVVNTLNSTGLLTGLEDGITAAEDDTLEPNGSSNQFTDEARNAEMETLIYIAEATGGTAIARSNDYLGGIRRIASPPEYRYILGFSPHDLASDGQIHALSIKLINPADKGYSVQARRGYFAPKQGEGLPEAAAKEIENAVFSRDDIRDLPVEMRTDVKKSEGSGGELTVSTDVDLQLLHYSKADGRNCQELTAVAAIFDRDGSFIAGKQQTLTLKLRDQTMDGLSQKSPETLQSSFALSPGTYLVRMVVRSAADQAMTEMSSQVDVR